MAIFDLNTIKQWFKKGAYPTQEQFWNTWDSFWHKNDKISIEQVADLDDLLSQKVDVADLQQHQDDRANPHQVSKAQVGLGHADNTADADKPVSTPVQQALDALSQASAQNLSTAIQQLSEAVNTLFEGENLQKVTDRGYQSSHPIKAAAAEFPDYLATLGQAQQAAANAASSYVAPLRDKLNALIADTENVTLRTLLDDLTAIQLLLQSDDLSLDTLQEIVAFIKNNKNVVDTVATNKLDKTLFEIWKTDTYTPFYQDFQAHHHDGVYLKQLKVGSVHSLPAGSAPILEVVGGDTLHLQLPKGDTGTAGPAGPAGLKGDAGPQGPAGPAGLSRYVAPTQTEGMFEIHMLANTPSYYAITAWSSPILTLARATSTNDYCQKFILINSTVDCSIQFANFGKVDTIVCPAGKTIEVSIVHVGVPGFTWNILASQPLLQVN